jgi:preprotein translocase subunit SecE
MAKNRNNNNPVADSEESDVMEGAERGGGSEERKPEARQAAGPGGLNLIKVFKPNQGKRVRMATGVGVGLLLLGAWDWIYRQLYTASFVNGREWVATAITLSFCTVVGLATWYLVGVRSGSVDFLIATESEMKKVTWSSRKEVWGATKVVIGMVILVTVGLFLVDIAFMWFFSRIGVLKLPSGGLV